MAEARRERERSREREERPREREDRPREREKDDKGRSGGMSMRTRFALMMSAALALVMAGAGLLLIRNASTISADVQETTLAKAALLSASAHNTEAIIEQTEVKLEVLRWCADFLATKGGEKTSAEIDVRIKQLEAYRKGIVAPWGQIEGETADLENGRVQRAPVEYGDQRLQATLYRVARADTAPFHLLVAEAATPEPGSALLGTIIGTVVLVILVGAGVSVWVAGQVSGPMEELVDDIRQISTGDLKHRTHARGSDELVSLARAIDRMTKNLADARETELALSIRDRELEVAAEVREALLPQTTPQLAGYEIGATHISSPELWGDFHDFIEIDGGRCLGLLVCDVSGKGLPGALVGATARSYLRSELEAGKDIKSAMQLVNRELARDVKRGMYVSALYVLIDPSQGIAHAVCAGHKIPLVRFSAADGKVRLIQPEGIALAFDKGPIFDRRLELAHVPIEPGDRLVLVNSGAVEVIDAQGKELGEKPLFAHILKGAALPTDQFLARMRAALEGLAGEAGLPRAISIVTVARRS
jgi:serine phosphatase RsbU (regulator of sigma subunit)